MKNCLLLGRKGMVIDELKANLSVSNINLFGATNLAEVEAIFSVHKMDIVIMGAGIELNDRLDIIRYVFENSKSTSVHMKDWNSGPSGMLPFVNGVLSGLK